MRKPRTTLEVPLDVRAQVLGVAQRLRRSPTQAEAAMWGALRGKELSGRRFRRQQPIGCFVVDFYCARERLIVEVDGPVHGERREADAERQRILESLGFSVLRFTNAQVLDHLPQVLETIAAWCDAPSQG